jgi:hypothetical protein
MPERSDINGLTKVADLLKEYPELEEVLIEQAPMFAKIQNPVLRKTVAKVATLERAAGMAGITVTSLVNALRTAAGLTPAAAESSESGGAEPAEAGKPDWAKNGKVVKKIDADGMLAEGVHPLNLVMETAGTLKEGETIRLDSSFPPIPLTDALSQKGYATFTGIVSTGGYETYIGTKLD